jgi:hypothetical protein
VWFDRYRNSATAASPDDDNDSGDRRRSVSEVFTELERLFAEDGKVPKEFRSDGVIHRHSRRNHDQRVYHWNPPTSRVTCEDRIRWVAQRMFAPPPAPPAPIPEPVVDAAAPPAASSTSAPAVSLISAPARPVAPVFQPPVEIVVPDELRPIDHAAELPPLLATLNAMIPDACDRIEWTALAAAADWRALRHVLRPAPRFVGALRTLLRKDGSNSLTIKEAAALFETAELLEAARGLRR